jgi:UDP-N-acetylmuramoyl-tripeptide--D-alanyl-D-alanine ligase
MRLDQTLLKKLIPEAQVISGELPDDLIFSVDSRTITNEQIFIPVKGVQVDGHLFLESALQKSKGAFVARSKKDLWQSIIKKYPNILIIELENPEQALFDLASFWRSQFTIPVVGITGSVGKTSTKVLLAQILTASSKNCFVSLGNQNTLYGAALNMVRLHEKHDFAVFEMGISKPGEMARIVQLVRPTTALITCIGHSHMQGLGSLQTIACEKRAIFTCFKEDSVGMINGDQTLLASVAYSHPVIRFGLKTTNQIQARNIKTTEEGLSFALKIYGKKYDLFLPGSSAQYINNMLAATAAAYFLGVKEELIVKELQHVVRPERRFQSCPLKGYKGVLIDDAYNASPESVKAALLALQGLKTKAKKILVLGDMLELGQTSAFWHRQIGRFLRKVPSLQSVILVGQQVEWVEKTVPTSIMVRRVPSWQEATEMLKSELDQESVVLVKGSFGMQLSKLIDQFVDKNYSHQAL